MLHFVTYYLERQRLVVSALRSDGAFATSRGVKAMSFLEDSFVVGDRVVNPLAGTVTWHGERRPIRRKALEVLAALAGAGGAVVSRETMIEQIWEGNFHVGDRAVHATICALRRALDDTDRLNPLIRTIPRKGYRLAVPADVMANDQLPSFGPGDLVSGSPGWRLVQPMGETEIAETWLAATDAPVQLQVLRFCKTESYLRFLRREVTLLRLLKTKLTNRANVVPIHSWQLDDPPYYVTPVAVLKLNPAGKAGLIAYEATKPLTVGESVPALTPRGRLKGAPA